MANELKIAQPSFDGSLDHALANASSIITRDYLDHLEAYPLVSPSAEDLDIDIAECGRFYQITKLVINRDENFLNKLTTIVNVVSSVECSLATIIKSDGRQIDYYIGIVSKKARSDRENDRKRRAANDAAFRGALMGNLPGTEVKEMTARETDQFRDQVLSCENSCCAAVSGLVALRDAEDKSLDGYVQGIENLVDSLKGQSYTVVMLADPVASSEIQTIRQGYEMLHTQLSAFARSEMTINESDTQSLSRARTEGIAEGISKGIALTQSKSDSRGRYSGRSIGFGVSFLVSANIGFNAGENSAETNTSGRTSTTTETNQRSRSVTDTVSSARTEGRSLQLHYENRSVRALLDRIEKYLERLDECESLGAFDCAAYIISDTRETAIVAAGNYNALMRGKNSGVQASHINLWYKPEETAVLGRYLSSMVHPRFWQNERDKIIVTPSSIVSGGELAIQVGLPKKSVSGMTVIPMAPFGRNVLRPAEGTITLGNLYHMGQDEGTGSEAQKVSLDLESLSMHTFITGSTGSGKSTAIYSILDKLMEHKGRDGRSGLTFLVIEPAKGEYKDRFGNQPNVSVYGTNEKKTPLLRINPFSFPEDTHVLEHIDRLIEIFNVCWPMYAAMPAILKDAVERAYRAAGWNLETSECRYRSKKNCPMFPSFIDVSEQIYTVMEESAYSSDSKGNYKGALATRLKSLTNGLYGQIFTNDELSGEELFDRNVIVDLSRTGSGETKALIMGILVMKLQEYRMANARGGNAPLRHVTVLEEAHHILKRASTGQSAEGANLLGKSVEMLANSIAEMRTFGEGFIIADQAPGLMDLSVIRNTNTKMILRLPDLNDRELVGRAAGLNEEQIRELSRLKTFVAAVYQNNWLEPVLCNMEVRFREPQLYRYVRPTGKKDRKMELLKFLLLPLDQRNRLDAGHIDELKEAAYAMPLSAPVKTAFLEYMRTTKNAEAQRLREQIIYQLFQPKAAFDMARPLETDLERWYAVFRERLEPSVLHLGEEDQRKIVANLIKEQARFEKGAQVKDLFERFMNHI